MKAKRKFKGRLIECPSCKSSLKVSWLSGMSVDTRFMYSNDSTSIVVGGEMEIQKIQGLDLGFELNNPLRCIKCGYVLQERSSEPSKDRAIFLEGMSYLTGDMEYDVDVIT